MFFNVGLNVFFLTDFQNYETWIHFLHFLLLPVCSSTVFYNLKFDHLCLYLLENVHVFLCFVFKID